jgi:hypothetical protein
MFFVIEPHILVTKLRSLVVVASVLMVQCLYTVRTRCASRIVPGGGGGADPEAIHNMCLI